MFFTMLVGFMMVCSTIIPPPPPWTLRVRDEHSSDVHPRCFPYVHYCGMCGCGHVRDCHKAVSGAAPSLRSPTLSVCLRNTTESLSALAVDVVQKATGVGVLNVLSDSEGLPASLAGLNLTEAEPQELPAVSVRLARQHLNDLFEDCGVQHMPELQT